MEVFYPSARLLLPACPALVARLGLLLLLPRYNFDLVQNFEFGHFVVGPQLLQHTVQVVVQRLDS